MAIPAQPGILRHSRTDRNPPLSPRRRESTPSSVIPAKAGIHNSRARGNSSSHYLNARKKTLRHSREGRNPPRHPSFPRRRESTIPAHAGIHRPTTPMPEKKHSVIPAFAGMMDGLDSRFHGNDMADLRGNDAVGLCGNDVAGVIAGGRFPPPSACARFHQGVSLYTSHESDGMITKTGESPVFSCTSYGTNFRERHEFLA